VAICVGERGEVSQIQDVSGKGCANFGVGANNLDPLRVKKRMRAKTSSILDSYILRLAQTSGLKIVRSILEFSRISTANLPRHDSIVIRLRRVFR
jgi:hypothetical protein